MLSKEDKANLRSDASKLANECVEHARSEARKISRFDEQVVLVASTKRGTRALLSSDTLGSYPSACAMADAGLHKLLSTYGQQSTALVKGAAETIKWALRAFAQYYANWLASTYDVSITIDVDLEAPANHWGMPKLRFCVVSTKEEDAEVEEARKKVEEAINAYESVLKKRRAGEL